MNKNELIKLGSKTARRGFQNEQEVIDRFNKWTTDNLAQKWLAAMGYDFSKIEYVKARKIRGQYKADIQVRIQVLIKLKKQEDIQNLQVKLVSNPQGFNQIDKRWVDRYIELWGMPKDVARLLKLFTGELESGRQDLNDYRRVTINEMAAADQKMIVDFFNIKKILVVSDLLKGRGEFSADWILVILKSNDSTKWVLKSINEAMNILGGGGVIITSHGSLRIGKILMQRKGGDNGRDTSKMLQFKINPVDLF